jgi:D-threo-aldose 1-dehydrogenase
MTMHTRRKFLGVTLKGATTAAATGLLAKTAFAANHDGTAREQSLDDGRSGHYRPPFAFGMGGVPLGNEFEYVTDDDAYATIEAAWNAGVRYLTWRLATD